MMDGGLLGQEPMAARLLGGPSGPFSNRMAWRIASRVVTINVAVTGAVVVLTALAAVLGGPLEPLPVAPRDDSPFSLASEIHGVLIAPVIETAVLVWLCHLFGGSELKLKPCLWGSAVPLGLMHAIKGWTAIISAVPSFLVFVMAYVLMRRRQATLRQSMAVLVVAHAAQNALLFAWAGWLGATQA